MGITAGSGTTIDTRTNVTGEHRQVMVVGNDGDTIGGLHPYGVLKTSGGEPTTLLYDAFDAATVDTNAWTDTSAGGGSLVIGTTGAITPTTGTTASANASAITIPTFNAMVPGFLQHSYAITLESGVAANLTASGSHRFWGTGTATAPTAAAPMTNGIGFEVGTDGKMYAVTYSAGTRTQVADLTSAGTGLAASKMPFDGLSHRYIIIQRTDRVYWFIDSLAGDPVATASFPSITVQYLPVRIAKINVTGSPVATTMTVLGLAVADTARNNHTLSDSTYMWRKAQVGKTGGLAIRGASTGSTSGAIAAAATGTVGPLDVSEAGVVSFIVKNTVAASAWAGAPVLVFEQSDDNVSWSALMVARSDNGQAGSTFTLGVGAANAEVVFDAALESVNYARCRVTTGPATNGLTVVIGTGGLAFSPIVTSVPTATSTATVSGVAASASSVTVLAANINRRGATIQNDTASVNLYLRLGAVAAATTSGNYTVLLVAGAYYEVPAFYNGEIRGIWSAATGFANVTELVG